MKKFLKLLLSPLLVLALILVPVNVQASNNSLMMVENTIDDSEAVLAFYDVASKTETLYTAKDLQERFSANLSGEISRAISLPVESPHVSSKKVLTMEEKADLIDANKNTIEEYGLNSTDNSCDSRSVTISDNRTIVADASDDPYYRIAKLRYRGYTSADLSSTKNYTGTGFAVGYNLCATARHCITDKYGNFSTNIRAYYGYDGEAGTYTHLLSDVTGFVYYPQYITGTNADGTITTDPNYDIAFIIWGSQTVHLTGCFGMSPTIVQNMNMNTAGYPVDLNSGLRMYEASGTVTSYSDSRLFCDDIYNASGQSGSPYFDDDLFVYGIITHKSSSGCSRGRRITSSLIQWLQGEGYV